MGGNAFRQILAKSAFPRMPPAVYQNLKTRLIPKLEEIYSHVAVPLEAPEKHDYGDLDFAVATPKIRTSENPSSPSVNVAHQVTLLGLGATHMVPMDGNRTSNFAIPIIPGEWRALGHGEEEDRARMSSESGELHYQVDVHVCSSVSEWERCLFVKSYGDLHVILGNILGDLKLNDKGLYLKVTGQPPFKLTDSVEHIMAFLGLPMEPWGAGFSTRREIFEWVASSYLFDKVKLKERKIASDRKMYWEFIAWAKEKRTSTIPQNVTDQEGREIPQKRLEETALDFFQKREEFDALRRELEERSRETQARKAFNGKTVAEWTGLTGKWFIVKRIMDEVRERVGGNQGAVEMMQTYGEDKLKAIVLDVAKDFAAGPSPTNEPVVEARSMLLGNVSLTSLPHSDSGES